MFDKINEMIRAGEWFVFGGSYHKAQVRGYLHEKSVWHGQKVTIEYGLTISMWYNTGEWVFIPIDQNAGVKITSEKIQFANLTLVSERLMDAWKDRESAKPNPEWDEDRAREARKEELRARYLKKLNKLLAGRTIALVQAIRYDAINCGDTHDAIVITLDNGSEVTFSYYCADSYMSGMEVKVNKHRRRL